MSVFLFKANNVLHSICPSAERKSGYLSFLAFYENKLTGKSIFQAIILEEPLFVRRLHSLHAVSE